ncbi:syndecan-4 isoform X2 [Denticeps clupeoides]|uniref:syndecan-4 isoform X2 n=1 Tax=Denticeps clupeoides TaxID=299321 RepID=UPI0010A33A93|nr:syndecan-4-like isoform X2 [Denticeps clupeoides]
MEKLFLVLCLIASVYSESVRETETWLPSEAQQDNDLVSSGDTSDLGFDDGDENYDDEDDDDYYDSELSGSGDDESYEDTKMITQKPVLIDNRIPEGRLIPKDPKPTINDMDLIEQNEVAPKHLHVEMSHATDEGFFKQTEVVIALIAGGVVGLLFAVLLILLLIYRMKKKDEGSYDLGKKPIYKKAPTAEIYA